jgi:hypothetical protein
MINTDYFRRLVFAARRSQRPPDASNTSALWAMDTINPNFIKGSTVRIRDNVNVMQRYPEIVGQNGTIKEVG